MAKNIVHICMKVSAGEKVLLVTDENVMGTVHIAIGDNASPTYGSVNVAPIHIDGVIGQPMLVVDGEMLIEEGRYLV